MPLKVGGFPEYTPSEQHVFDDLVAIIKKSYISYGYMHIETPAVERNDVLLKGGASASKEVFGLYGMASGADDLKGYGLHFDLTIPFARYVLDNQSSLVFPFKRYQMQNCRRGERAQRGRFRQFKQADIDAIWQQHTDQVKYLFYDAEIIYLLRATLEQVRLKYLGNKTIQTHINNRNILGGLFAHITDGDTDAIEALSKLFDSYYKIDAETFAKQGLEIAGATGWKTIEAFLAMGLDQLSEDFIENEEFAQGVRELQEVCRIINELNTDLGEVFVYDPFIVRGLDYYTGTVFENLIAGEVELGSVCSGGRYANLTQAIDPKSMQFDGVGGSIGISRLFTIIQERIKELNTRKKGIVMVHFAETLPEIIKLARYFKEQKVAVDIYPGPDKLGKQFGYADKLQVKQVVMLGSGELEKGVYVIKDMESGEQAEKALPRL